MDNTENLPLPPMPPDSFNLTNRIAQVLVLTLAVGAGCIAWRWMHPTVTFAADGTDARWDAAVEQSHAAHTPALVLFTADWCPACNALHSQVLSRGDIEDEINSHYTMITIDLTERTHSAGMRAEKFGIHAIPTIIRFNAEGKETDRVHFQSPEQMLAWLRAGE